MIAVFYMWVHEKCDGSDEDVAEVMTTDRHIIRTG